jgi:4-hydroxy-4-methyl-2-oxoglutarate aldolase
METESLAHAFAELSTPLIADAALRLKVPLRISPPGIRPVTPNQRLAGPVLPVRHFGSVDVFLEAMQNARPGEVLVIDNGGRLDEGCIGDLTALEAEHCGLADADAALGFRFVLRNEPIEQWLEHHAQHTYRP